MKALYLDGRSGADVSLDGPALRVRTPGRADGRYPLARLSRIVMCGAVRFQPQALLACLHCAVPIAVLDNQGRFVRLSFFSASAHGLARHLGELLGVPRYRHRYEAWLKSAEDSEMRRAARQMGLSGHFLQPRALWQQLCRTQTALAGRRIGHVYRMLRGLAMAHVATCFAQLGMPRDPEAWSPQEWRILKDFVSLLEWRHPALVGKLIAQGEVIDRRTVAHLFEAESLEREQRIGAWRQALLLAMLGITVAAESGSWPGIPTARGVCLPEEFRRSVPVRASAPWPQTRSCTEQPRIFGNPTRITSSVQSFRAKGRFILHESL